MEAEISTNGRTIWINSDQGVCIGRFCPISGEVASPGDPLALMLKTVAQESFDSWSARVQALWPDILIDPKLRPEWERNAR